MQRHKGRIGLRRGRWYLGARRRLRAARRIFSLGKTAALDSMRFAGTKPFNAGHPAPKLGSKR